MSGVAIWLLILLALIEGFFANKPIDNKTSLPKGLAAKLYRYQETGYRWMLYMLEENKGCILGDECHRVLDKCLHCNLAKVCKPCVLHSRCSFFPKLYNLIKNA